MSKVSGTIVRHIIEGREISFFVVDPLDAIQKHHLDGMFYEQEELALISQFLRADRAFVDVGANVGNHAIFVSKLRRSSKVIVFEPNPVAIEILRINLLLNQCENVDTRFLGIALGASDNIVRVVDDPRPHNLGGAGVAMDVDGDVVLMAADSLLAGESVGFIKVDVEGLELQVLEGLKDTIRRWRPTMFVEVMEDNTDAFLAWVSNSPYHVGGTIRRYEGVLNYLLLSGAGTQT
jgi:FkbM family methyltransferase